MSEERCGVDISQVREAQPTGELDWLEKFETTCSEDAGHEGAHVFRSEDEERLHWNEATKQLGSYQNAPAEQQNTFTLSF
jgi:hypothetical protein